MVALRALWLCLPGLALLVAFPSCSPRESTLAEVERVDGLLVFKDGGKPLTGILVDHYPGGTPRSRTEVRKGVFHGRSEGWFVDGTREVEEFFVDGVSHGKRTRWHPNGKTSSEATVVNGEITGTFRRWHPNGLLAEEISMVSGQPEGRSKSFRPDGSPLAEVVFKNHQIVSSQYWNADGTPRQ